MFVLGLVMSQWMIGILVVLFVFISLLLMLTILIQKPQGGGLAGAFGSGAGSGQTAFGAKTGDALTIATISIFVLWTLFGVGLNYALTPSTEVVPESVISPEDEGGDQAPAPAGTDGTKPSTAAPGAGDQKPAAAPVTPAAPTDKPAEKPAEGTGAPAATPPTTTPTTTPPATPPAEKPADEPKPATPPSF